MPFTRVSPIPILLALLALPIAGGCGGSSGPTIPPTPPPVDCASVVPQPTVDQCLDQTWMAGQHAALPSNCSDLLVTRCYAAFATVQSAERLKTAACDDYWRPCTLPSDCSVGSQPKICSRIVLALYPTTFRTDGYVGGNEIGMTCRQYHVPPRPQSAVSGSPIDEQLQGAIWSRINPWFDTLQLGPALAFDPTATATSSLSTPVEPTSVPIPAALQAGSPLTSGDTARIVALGSTPVVPPGKYSLNVGPLALTCVSDGQLQPNVSWRSNGYFDDPFGIHKQEIQDVASCDDYAKHKYYDWAVFRIRMQRDLMGLDDVPDILRVAAAFDATARGNVGWLVRNQNVVSRSWYPALFSVAPNPAFPLTAGVARAPSLVQELLMGTKRKVDAAKAADHAHRLIFSGALLATYSQPCSGLAGCTTATTSETWAWHGDSYGAYVRYGITAVQEAVMRLRREQVLELYARRAQLEMAARLAGRDVVTPALDVLWAPAVGITETVRASSLARGELASTLGSISWRERAFLREQFARDWAAVKADVASRTQTDLEARLKGLDEHIESVLTAASQQGWTEPFTSCLAANPHVLCTWLPEMFVDRFQGVREEQLMNLPPVVRADSPNVGPSADQRRCLGFMRGVNFARLKTSFPFECPLNSPVGSVSQFEVCGCTPAPADVHMAKAHYHCGELATPNDPATVTYPVFYPPVSYRDDHRGIENFITRAGKMDEVAFAVATAFIPQCSTSPTMTEVHTASQKFGNALVGATLEENFLWSKDGLTDASVLEASVSASSVFLSSHSEFLHVSAHGERGTGTTGTGTIVVRVAGVDRTWPLSRSTQSSEFTGWSDTYYFSIGPVPISVSYGVGGGWGLDTAVTLVPEPAVDASAKAFTSLFVEGGVDAGIVGAGVGASIDVVEIGPVFSGRLAMRTTPPGSSGGSTSSVALVSKLELETTLLSGRFYAWAKVGACPLCKKFDITLFDWTGFRQGTVIWDRSFNLTEKNLDKLAKWSRPNSCT